MNIELPNDKSVALAAKLQFEVLIWLLPPSYL